MSPSCPSELGAAPGSLEAGSHMMTDRLQQEQIGLELTPEKIVARRAQAGCIRESTEANVCVICKCHYEGTEEQMSILDSKG